MGIADINHNVCIMCDNYNEENCLYCGMAFDGFSLEKHDKQIRVDVINDCLKIVEYHSKAYDGIYFALRELKELRDREVRDE